MHSVQESLQDRVDKLLFSLSSLGDIGEALTSTGDFSATVRALLHLVLGVLTISKGAMLLFDGEQKTLSVWTARGLGRARLRLRLEDEWVQMLVKEAYRPLSRSELDGLLKPMVYRYAAQLDALQVHLWVPLVVQDRLLGVLSVSERFLQRAYADEDLELLSTIARHISVGLYNHRLIEEIKASNFRLNHKVLELETLYDVGMAITSVLDISELVEEILIRLVGILDVRGGFLMLQDEAGGSLDTAACFGIEEEEIGRMRFSGDGDVLAEAMGTGRSCILNGLGEQLGSVSFRNLMVIPLKGGEEVLGVLGVVDRERREGGVMEFTEEDERLAYSFANQAGVAVANARLIEETEALFEAFVKVMATAIDEKARYTRGHIERVALLTMALAEAVSQTNEGPYADVRFSEEELNELRIAGWMHDVGKVTTPEWVVDKATKLQTVFDRIELVKTRFEMIRERLRAQALQRKVDLLEQGKGRAALHEVDMELERQVQELDEDFRFLIRVNVPQGLMQEEDLERLQQVARKTYIEDGKARPYLTQDELENLSIREGSLTDAELEVMHNHAAVTLKMLQHIPFTKKLRNVPWYAGAHHEKLDGSGYPLGISGDQLPLQTRILAVADIFEALIATCRPYKKPKTLEETIRILRLMVQDGHLDAAVVDLLVEENVYHRVPEIGEVVSSTF